MDVVYPLGHGSAHGDLELLFSLRSLEQYVTDIDRVIIIGKRPNWLRNVIHLPYPDRHACKEANIMLKVMYAIAEIGDLSKLFLHVHDDHFCLAPVAAGDIPYWRGGMLSGLAQRLPPSANYRKSLENTHTALNEAGFSTWNFDLHVPIIYDKHHYVDINTRFNWDTRHGFVVKSLYANALGIPGVPMGDLKLFNRLDLPGLVTSLKGRPWWSIASSAMGSPLRSLMAELYPQPSRWEA